MAPISFGATVHNRTSVDPRGKVDHEPPSADRVAATNVPGNRELRVSVDADPSPSVASTGRSRLGVLDIALFGVGERPDFVDLHPLDFRFRTALS